MKITSFQVNSINPYNKHQRSEKAANGKSNFADKIEISTTAKEMSASSTYSSERAQKMHNLKEQIQSGEYQVNARKVAEDMLKYYKY